MPPVSLTLLAPPPPTPPVPREVANAAPPVLAAIEDTAAAPIEARIATDEAAVIVFAIADAWVSERGQVGIGLGSRLRET